MKSILTALDMLEPFLEQDDCQFSSVLFSHKTLDLVQCTLQFSCHNIM